jgi:hypothetical protein
MIVVGTNGVMGLMYTKEYHFMASRISFKGHSRKVDF